MSKSATDVTETRWVISISSISILSENTTTPRTQLFTVLYVLTTDYLFYKLLQCIPGPVPSREGKTTSTYLLTYLPITRRV